MKRALVTILAFLYLAASGGAVVNVHWCMGRIAGKSISLGDDSDHHACKRCGMEKGSKKGCCHDEHKIIKAADDQSLAAKVLLHLNAPVILPQQGFAFAYPSSDNSRHALLAVAPSHGPPLKPDLPIYLQVRCLRI